MPDIMKSVHYVTLVLYAAALFLSFLKTRSGLTGRLAYWAVSAGFLAQLGLFGARWYLMGYLPVTGLFSALHFLVMWMVAILLYFAWRYYASNLFSGVLLVSVLSLLKAGDGDMALAPLTPALDTPLFFLHVAPSFAAYGLFAVAAVISVYRLSGVGASEWGHERRMLDESVYLGYIFLSWCMIAGSLWAYLAWGSYWTWRIKGLWTTLLWFYYSGLIHVRNRGRWQGWPVDVMTIAGFFLVLFTFLGLGLLFPENSHPLK